MVNPDWLSGWGYRKSHEIEGSSAGAQTNYQVKIIVHYESGTDYNDNTKTPPEGHVYVGGKSRADFQDIRFTKDDGVTELDYWFENKDTAEADGYGIFWVEVDSIPASPDTTQIYIYYGNPTATTTSNGYNTFLVFANFDDGTIDGFTARLGTFDNPADYLRSINTAGKAHVARKGGTYSDFAVACKVKTPSGVTVREMGIIARWDDSLVDTYDVTNVYMFRISSSTLWELYKRVGTEDWSKLQEGSGSYAADTWYTLELRLAGSKISKSINGEVVGTTVTDTSFSSGYAGIRSHFNEYRYWDDFRVRKYVDPEPSHGSWGSEETPAPLLIHRLPARIPARNPIYKVPA